MKHVMLASCALTLGIACGCSSTPAERDNIEPVDRGVVKAAKLDALPLAVTQSFLRDFPNAGVTDIEVLDAATGLVIYEINYLQNGRAGDVLYRPDGSRVTKRGARSPAVEAPAPRNRSFSK